MSQHKTVFSSPIKRIVRSKKVLLSFLLGTGLLSNGLLSNSFAAIATEENMVPPMVTKQSHKMEIHGDTRIDNYYWLRDDNRQDKSVIDYLTAENQYTEKMLKSGQELRETLYKEMTDRMSKEDQSVPYTYMY
ncbi:putative Oligopeptidase (Fragment) [Xenorhabdus nematophila ATCC 19061]|uniref:Oligopeptidase n=1 Tax=Xenorhabdus nematophila (strain ATCC 19061 / DSM 3370 / CCUG 14189 / LMG 1036 / NCIMB 9965 / AN6) TaxID=406817 RepID=D3VI61_XENNA